MKHMWDDKPGGRKKGLLEILLQEPNIVEFNPSAYTLEDMERDWQAILQAEQDRRERLNKEYTPLSEITSKEIDDASRPYGDNIPIGLFVKVSVGGQYLDVPLKALVQIRDKAKEMFENQNKTKTEPL